ncbi:aminoglycoside adenylyltransferase family protein [Streptomyces otsuchiensis]|uniref:aminoglycoside adenylyltransferase family protein n=1 Tax=Streptomyces otsuchiensis TaxID=2681388 RepID=UPI001032719B|nr:aminoglycoside adenylyltransferase family protein [Streptomyces otsuchiensis]
MTRTDDVVLVVQEILGPDVVGQYAHGSATLGGLRPHSDLDVLGVLRRPTTAGERRRLVRRIMTLSGDRAHGGPARPVELTLVVQSEVRPWRYPPRCEFQYGEWLREAYERGEVPEPGPSPDLAPLITMVLGAATPLAGPPPAQVLAPVPQADLLRAITEGVPELLAEVGTDTRNVLLTLARVWTTIVTGEIVAKDAAADWALPRLPAGHRPALAHARAVYLGQDRDRWEDRPGAAAALGTYLAARIEEAAGEAVAGEASPPDTAS